MFQSTQPADAAGLMRVSDFERDRGGPATVEDTQAGATRLSALNPSLVQDLLRFERGQRPGAGLDVLEVLAAAVRHSRELMLYLQLDYRVIPLTVRPTRRRAEAPLALDRLLDLRLPELRVLRVEPAPPEPAEETEPAAVERHLLPLGLLLWEMALRGARGTLLPEIAGVAAYRVMPGPELRALDLTGSIAVAVDRLQRQPVPLREIAAWPGFDPDRAQRLLNGLYLQAALMISRTHPGAIQGA